MNDEPPPTKAGPSGEEIVVTRASVKGFAIHPVEYNLWLGKAWLDK